MRLMLLKGEMRGSPPTSEYEKGKGWKGVEVGRILPAFQRARIGFKYMKVTTDSAVARALSTREDHLRKRTKVG